MVVYNVGAYRVEALNGLVEVFVGHFRAQKYMAGVYSLATLFNKLYDVVAVFGFYNLRYFFGVVEIECHGCILSHKIGNAL